MPAVRFHFNVPDLPVYVCRLLRKAVGSGAKVVVCGPEPLLGKIDQLLWTFSPQDFVPHCRDTAPKALLEASPVVLHLHDEVPAGHEGFARIVEIVSLDDAARQLARQRWKHYTGAGFAIERHDVAMQQENA
jgi:DNA polymerase III subunit chi